MSTFKFTEEVTGEIVQIPIGMLYHHPDNPRKNIGDISELSNSIKVKGILQNLTVVPRTAENGYYVVIGNRRLEAAKAAGFEFLPCIIASMTPAEQVQTMLLENMQRSDLTVYEQAKGFQMMIDFGDDVDSVAEKTGFSTTTVRRRLKMAELDEETLKEVSERQVSLLDFDRLAKIESLKERNRLLGMMGTYNFNNAIEAAYNSQESTKTLPAMKAYIKKIQAKKITWSETYGGKYSQIGERVYLRKWDKKPLPFPDNKKIYYMMREDLSDMYVEFYIESERAKPVKRTKAEIESERLAREAADKLKEAASIHFKLRRDFAKTIRITSKNRQLLVLHLSKALTLSIISWIRSARGEDLAEACGMSRDEYLSIEYVDRPEKFYELFEQDESMIPRLLCVFLGDHEANWYFHLSEYELKAGRLPKYEKNASLDLIYDFLCAFGYEMSDEEKAIKDGSSPYFADKRSER